MNKQYTVQFLLHYNSVSVIGNDFETDTVSKICSVYEGHPYLDLKVGDEVEYEKTIDNTVAIWIAKGIATVNQIEIFPEMRIV